MPCSFVVTLPMMFGGGGEEGWAGREGILKSSYVVHKLRRCKCVKIWYRFHIYILWNCVAFQSMRAYIFRHARSISRAQCMCTDHQGIV